MTSDDAASCSCAAPLLDENGASLESFAKVRACCPALHQVLLPDSIWHEFQDWCTNPDDVAGHRSVLWIAHQRHCLHRVTSPIHRYLLTGATIRSNVREQYIKDLQERWLGNEEPLERHRKWRIFQGHLAELQLAVWLEDQSYAIEGLEALREGPDIEATSADGLSTAFEVKYIGLEDGDFQLRIDCDAGRTVSVPGPINYLIFRIYEAAKQLQRAHANRTAAVIIDYDAWFRFELGFGSINWKNPEFLAAAGEQWDAFIAKQNEKYPQLTNELAETICSLDSIWVIVQSSDFSFSEKCIHVKSIGRRS